MARIDAELEAKIIQAPEQEQQVVITVAQGSEHDVSALGLSEAREVAPGVYSGSCSGEQLLKLSQEDAIEEIVPDSEVGILPNEGTP